MGRVAKETKGEKDKKEERIEKGCHISIQSEREVSSINDDGSH